MIPERLDLDVFRSREAAMPDLWGNTVGRWLLSRRDQMHPWAPEGTRKTRWILNDIDEAPGLSELRPQVVNLAAEAGLPDGSSWLVWAAAAHHRNGQDWYRHPEDPEAKAAFCLTLHTPERLFEGGQLEFWSGARVEPAHCTLTVWRPSAAFRIVPVECWATGIAYARWSIEGILK